MVYKMILLDMDGTLLNSNKKIDKETKNVLIEMQTKGSRIVLASGRPTNGMLKYAQELKMDIFDGYLISYNGACVYSMKDDKTIWEKYLKVDDVKEILQNLEQFDVIPMLDEDEFMYVEDVFKTIAIKGNEHFNVIEYESRSGGFLLRETKSLKSWVKTPQYKILVAGDEAYLEMIHSKLADPFGDKYTSGFTGPFYYEYTSKEASKGHAFEALLDYLETDNSKTIGFGDGMNDLSLFEKVETSVAMENAVEQVKSAANFITSSNDNQGIVKFLLR